MSKNTEGDNLLDSAMSGCDLSSNFRPIVDCDVECWVKERIATAIRMSLQIQDERKVRADDSIAFSAIEGIVNGAAVEVIHHLGLTPGYINLRQSRTTI